MELLERWPGWLTRAGNDGGGMAIPAAGRGQPDRSAASGECRSGVDLFAAFAAGIVDLRTDEFGNGSSDAPVHRDGECRR
jgi:hypothetical protein